VSRILSVEPRVINVKNIQFESRVVSVKNT